MTLDNAIKNNPYDENKGNLSAYIRYLRYNVDSWYNKKSEDIKMYLSQNKINIKDGQ